MTGPPNRERRPGEGRRSSTLDGCGGGDKHNPPPFVTYRYGYHGCGCTDRLAALERLVGRLFDVDADLLTLLDRPDVLAGTPSTWEAMVAAGFDPLTGAER
jgi:hypothetical protein